MEIGKFELIGMFFGLARSVKLVFGICDRRKIRDVGCKAKKQVPVPDITQEVYEVYDYSKAFGAFENEELLNI